MIERTKDINLINDTVMLMFDDVVEDGTIKDCFNLDVEADCWLKCTDKGVFVGLFKLSPFNRTVLDMHCYILKDKRNKSSKYGKEALLWVKDEAPEMYSKIITQTPFVHIKKWLLSLGFELEGCYKKSFTKRNKILDLSLFGLSREDICQ